MLITLMLTSRPRSDFLTLVERWFGPSSHWVHFHRLAEGGVCFNVSGSGSATRSGGNPGLHRLSIRYGTLAFRIHSKLTGFARCRRKKARTGLNLIVSLESTVTTGSYSLDQFTAHAGSGSWTGTKGSVSWNGADDPRNPKIAATYHIIHREVQEGNFGKSRIVSYRIRQPGYTPKRAKHGLHSYTKTYQRLEQALITGSDGRTWPDMWAATPGAWGQETLLTANDQIRLIGKLNEQLQGSDFNMSVFLGEGHQTLKMLTDSAIRIAKAGHSLRRGDFSGAVRSLFEGTTRSPLRKHDWRNNRPLEGSAKNLANNWLELQYGWLPLLNDAEECAKSLAHYLNWPAQQRYRCAVRREKDYTVTINNGTIGIMTTPVTKSHRRGLIAVISEKPSVLAQLGLLDPELVAWELMPFSFVADWFIPIGSWMEARAKASRLTGTFITSEKRMAIAGPTRQNGVQKTKSAYYGLDFTRSISTSLSVPMPAFKPLEKVASWRHCANAVALVTQVFTGKKTRSLDPLRREGGSPLYKWPPGFHP